MVAHLEHINSHPKSHFRLGVTQISRKFEKKNNYSFRAAIDQRTDPLHSHDNNHGTVEQKGYICSTYKSNFCTLHSSNKDIGYLFASKFLQQNPIYRCEVDAAFFIPWVLSCILCLNRGMIGLLDNSNFIFKCVHCKIVAKSELWVSSLLHSLSL